MIFRRIKSKSVITAAIAIGMFLSLTTARSEPVQGGGARPRSQNDVSIELAKDSCHHPCRAGCRPLTE